MKDERLLQILENKGAREFKVFLRGNLILGIITRTKMSFEALVQLFDENIQMEFGQLSNISHKRPELPASSLFCQRMITIALSTKQPSL